VRGLQPVAALVAGHGPAARRVPAEYRARVQSAAALKTAEGVRLHQFGTREVVAVPISGSRVSLGGYGRTLHRRRLLPAPFAAELPDVTLVGRHATPVTSSGRVILSPFAHNISMIDADGELEIFRPDVADAPDFRDVDVGTEDRPLLSLVGRLDSNYYHWLVDFCTQLEAAAVFTRSTGRRPRILIRRPAPSFVRTTLATLGFTEDDLVEWPAAWDWHEGGDDPRLRTHVSSLIVTSPRGAAGVPSLRALRWLRGLMLDRVGGPQDPATSDPPGSRKIFVHRRPGGWRSIANSDDVVDAVDARGFQVLCPEDFAFPAQVTAFAAADVVVGLHGAGLTNVLFSTGAELVEIAGDYGGIEFAAVARAAGGRHCRLAATQRPDDTVEVDLTRLTMTLDELERRHGATSRRQGLGAVRA
jgi:hypothetical protein